MIGSAFFISLISNMASVSQEVHVRPEHIYCKLSLLLHAKTDRVGDLQNSVDNFLLHNWLVLAQNFPHIYPYKRPIKELSNEVK